MRKHLIALILLALTIGKGWTAIDYSAMVIQDPKTKVVYYLESDRRHIAAISPAGKLLWCSEVVRIPSKDWKGIKPQRIQALWFMSPGDKSCGEGNAENYIKVSIIGEGFGGMTGYLEKKTGKFI